MTDPDNRRTARWLPTADTTMIVAPSATMTPTMLTSRLRRMDTVRAMADSPSAHHIVAQRPITRIAITQTTGTQRINDHATQSTMTRVDGGNSRMG